MFCVPLSGVGSCFPVYHSDVLQTSGYVRMVRRLNSFFAAVFDGSFRYCFDKFVLKDLGLRYIGAAA